MKMKKWTYEIIIVAILACAGPCVWWYISTGEARKADAEFQQLVDYANKQQVEIVIIKQGVELRRLRAEFAADQQKEQDDLQNNLKPK